MKQMIKKVLPKAVWNLRHYFIEKKAAAKFGRPSEELFVIGITGTSGKSSTTYYLRQMLEAAGHTVGSLSTIDFYVAGENKLNDKKMTMLGLGQTQKYLREMVDAGCDVAIVETTSEGFLQHRHRFINYDVMVLTNLYPEHIDAHGSYENYKNAKLGIFKHVANQENKRLKGEWVEKVAVINGSVKEADEFLDACCQKNIIFARNDEELFVEESRLRHDIAEIVLSKNIHSDKDGLHFDIEEHHFDIAMYGEHNVMNITNAVAVARALGTDWGPILKTTRGFKNAPGRVEFIKEAEKHGFQAIVDYAFEPIAMNKLYKIVDLLEPKRIIHVLGSTGGGRDVERRFTVGELVGKQADIVIVTDEDPYDDDPMEIINDVASAVEKTGKKEGKTLFKILERKEAIEKAIELAKKGDMVLCTGKGSEQAMVVKGKLIPWDERKTVRKALKQKKK